LGQYNFDVDAVVVQVETHRTGELRHCHCSSLSSLVIVIVDVIV
jgi:hypothetical protein